MEKNFLTRAEVARKLDIDSAAVERLESEGMLDLMWENNKYRERNRLVITLQSYMWLIGSWDNPSYLRKYNQVVRGQL